MSQIHGIQAYCGVVQGSPKLIQCFSVRDDFTPVRYICYFMTETYAGPGRSLCLQVLLPLLLW